MPEIIECPECQRKLSMKEEFLGSQVKCPSCGCTFIASTSNRPAPLPPPPPPPPEQPRRDDDDRPRRRRDSYDDDRPRRDYDRDDDRPRRRRDPYDDDRVKADRGAAVLTLGILGLVFSCIPIVGWVLGGIALGMGNTDLGEMARGRMSRAGEGATQGGKICGLIAVIVSTLFVFFWCIGFANNRYYYM